MKIILSILLFCSVLLADRDGGPYIGLGYGTSTFNDDNLYKEQKENDSTALIFYAGAYINKHLSVEFSYVEFNMENDYTVIDDSNIEKSINFSSYNISTLAHYSFYDDIVDFYAKFGVGQVAASGVGTSGFAMLYGAGMGIRFSEMFSLRIAYDRYVIEHRKDIVEKNMNIDFMYSAFEVQF